MIDIDLTRVHARLRYLDSGSQVYGGYDPFDQCFWLADWINLYCQASWWPYGPSLVYTMTEGSFRFRFSQSWQHWHRARYEGQPGGWNRWWCERSGATVPGGFWKCEGGRQPG